MIDSMMDMKDTLNSIYLRLDVNMQYLTSKAIAQIIVKMLYSNGNASMSAGDIKRELAKLNDGNRFDDTEIDEIIKDLENKEIRQRNGRYYLSTSRTETIRKSLEESNTRQDQIIDRYFNGLNSSKEELKDWLSIIMRAFFETYSNEWISDISAHTNHISESADSIRLQVTRRTDSVDNLDSEDKKILPSRFFSFVTSHDPEVDDYLWGYGTSAFASKLIRNRFGVDKLTMNAFKDSTCYLDTNVLLFIALESKYADSFRAIEKVFLDLNIQPKYLYITQKEYENKIIAQKDITLSNFDRFGYDTISRSDDDFTQSALRLRCKTREDFERFFDFDLSIPQHVFNNLAIKLADNDAELVDVIERAQNDVRLIDELNTMFKEITGHDKSQSSCRHDIGLLEGVRFLRNKPEHSHDKFFIISDELSVNQYSKSKGTKNNLPLSLRVDTLINMLAVNNGGDTFDAADYKSLFANIIRMGLIPHKDTFSQEELFQLSQMNDRISTLPPEQVFDIAQQIHRLMLNGESESDLRRKLGNLVTRGELQTKDEIKDLKGLLTVQGEEKKRLKEGLQIAQRVVRNTVEKEYDRKTIFIVLGWCFGMVAFVGAIFWVYSYILHHNSTNVDLQASLNVGIVASAIVAIVGGLVARWRVLHNRKKERDRYIEEETNKRLQNSD